MLNRIIVTLGIFILLINTADGKNLIAHDIFIYNNQLTTAFDFSELFDQTFLDEFEAGYPLYLKFTVNLHKSVPLWFDPTLKSYSASLMLEHEKFGDRYKLKIFNYNSTVYEFTHQDIGEIIDHINDRMILAVAQTAGLNAGDKMYLRFILKLRRLTAKDISRASDWYRGKSTPAKDSGFKGEELPIHIFDQILNISGLGPRKIEIQSQLFNLNQLKTVQPQN